MVNSGQMVLEDGVVDRVGVAESRRPVRILFIIDSIWGAGGAEMSLLRLVKNLPSNRYDCRVITFHTSDSAKPFIARFPCPVEHWPMKSLVHISILGLTRRLYRFIRDQKIDIVHTFFPTADLWAAPIAKATGFPKLISSRRDMGVFREGWQNWGYRLAAGLFDQVHAVSEQVRHYSIKKDRIDSGRAVVVYNGVDMDDVNVGVSADEMRRTLECAPDQKIITTVANIRRVKGIDVLLQAAARVKQAYPDVLFVIAGGFSTTPDNVRFASEVRQLTSALGLEKSVRFLGSSTRIPELLQASDIFILPSRSEGFSNALLEAMSFALPCIATRVGGNPEVVVDGVTGFLVPPDDVVALADKTLTLLRSAQLRLEFGSAARARVGSNFTTAAMVSCVVSSYETLLQRP
jgi:glycosyltransferase involved in cell wall biosynthesis